MRLSVSVSVRILGVRLLCLVLGSFVRKCDLFIGVEYGQLETGKYFNEVTPLGLINLYHDKPRLDHNSIQVFKVKWKE